MSYAEGKIDDGGARIDYGAGAAVREPATGKGRYDLVTPFGVQRLAKWYELGAQKYADRNWEKGMPFSRYIDSAKRHIDKYVMGMEDEDHLAAAAWNILAIMHHEELGQTQFDDMPHYLSATRPDPDQITFDDICPGGNSLESAKYFLAHQGNGAQSSAQAMLDAVLSQAGKE